MDSNITVALKSNIMSSLLFSAVFRDYFWLYFFKYSFSTILEFKFFILKIPEDVLFIY